MAKDLVGKVAIITGGAGGIGKALAQELGGDAITAVSATTALQDPHRIEARPSLIASVRNADLLPMVYRANVGALLLPFAEPTGYGLGKSGWVSARFEGTSPPLPVLCRWIDESYRAIAPKTLVKALPEAGPGEATPAPARKTRKKA